MKTHNNKMTLEKKFLVTLAFGALILGSSAAYAYAPAPEPDVDSLVQSVIAHEHPNQPLQATLPQAQPVIPAAMAPSSQPVVIPLSQPTVQAQAPVRLVEQPAPIPVRVHTAAQAPVKVAKPRPVATAISSEAAPAAEASIARVGEVHPDQGQDVAAQAPALSPVAHRWMNAFNAIVVIALILLAVLNYWLWASARKLSTDASDQLTTAKRALEDVQAAAVASDRVEPVKQPAKKKASVVKIEPGKETAA